MNCGYKQFVVRRRYTNFCGRKTDITIPLLNNSIKGNSRIKTAKIFQVHYETIGERVKKYKETGEKKDREFKRKPKKIDPEKPEKYIEKHPDAYLREIDTYLHREYARSKRGKKVIERISGKKYKRESVVAGKIGNKLIAPLLLSTEKLY